MKVVELFKKLDQWAAGGLCPDKSEAALARLRELIEKFPEQSREAQRRNHAIIANALADKYAQSFSGFDRRQFLWRCGVAI